MSYNYVPIFKWKRGEQNALKELKSLTQSNITPLLELDASNMDKFIPQLNLIWPGKTYLLDITISMSADEDDSIDFLSFYKTCNPNFTIPVLPFDTSPTFIQELNTYSKSGIAFRISTNLIDELEDTLHSLLLSSSVSPHDTDLIIDLKEISVENLSEKLTVLSAIVTQIPQLTTFRNIIIASCSFPPSFDSISKNDSAIFPRLENKVHERATKLSNKFNFNYTYSDYGASSLNVTEFRPGMSPAFKIKYSTSEHYICYKGLQTKKAGLDIINVQPLCQELLSSPYYLGKDFSWGDAFIDEVCTKTSSDKCGNLTTWVQVAQNHHVELITNLLSNPV